MATDRAVDVGASRVAKVHTVVRFLYDDGAALIAYGCGGRRESVSREIMDKYGLFCLIFVALSRLPST